MIYDVFLPFIIIFSIFSIIIILARKIPDISLEAEAKKDWLSEEAKKQHKATVLFCKALSILEKTLRQLRIHILKLDAKIFGLIQYLRDKSAKKLEEINKLSHKSFTPIIDKKARKFESQAKPQSGGKDILPAVSVHSAPLADSSSAPKSIKTHGHPNKIFIKFQFKVEEKKLLHIIAKNPKNAENYKKLGMLYYKNENLLDAEAAFTEYLKLNPSDNQAKEILKKVALKNQGKKI
ncbi:hypothetical protein KKB43_01260 [Patescibacteria group bacterium]|nr:hypothetical protein [Patescibacteria group bacterium]MBU4579623.1 hypothetical protein [Patescibacteria group bacterium]